MRALDISRYQGRPSPAFWQYAYGAGVRLAIVAGANGIPNTSCLAAMGDAKAAGMMLASYAWPPAAWQTALGQCGAFAGQLAFLALDVERGSTGTVAVQRVHIDGLRAVGVQPVIYTSQSAWSANMGASTVFDADVSLWDAGYPRDAAGNYIYSPDKWPDEAADLWGGFVHYGGWTRRVGWQCRGTVSLGGLGSADLSVFDDRWLEGIMGITEERARQIAEEVMHQHYVDTHQYDWWPAVGAAEGTTSVPLRERLISHFRAQVQRIRKRPPPV